MDISNLINLFNNNNNNNNNTPSQNTTNTNNNILNKENYIQHQNNIPKEIIESYPYGQFPFSHSKEVQNEKLKNILTTNTTSNISDFNFNQSTYQNNQTDPKNNQTENISAHNTPNSQSFNNQSQLLNILSNALSSQNNSESNTSNIANLLLPLLFNNNPQISQLLKMFNNSNISKQNIESEKKICVENTYLKNENYNPLNSYERI